MSFEVSLLRTEGGGLSAPRSRTLSGPPPEDIWEQKMGVGV